ncbi:MAG TPA: metallophosphoesterase family protein, partial [Thermoanaerobaculia bacterium]|nr:metallophosphoesterase family protein [Thermoanaerobaculia bacterium]
YGASPNQVVEALRDLKRRTLWVRGNHDKVVAGIESGENFNQVARRAAEWTSKKMSAENLRFVRRLPSGPIKAQQGVLLCHGSPLDEDMYIFSAQDTVEVFQGIQSPIVFFGHTHIASVFILEGDEIEARLLREDAGRMDLDPGCRYLINPGSIGQPRDHDPRAAHMVFDSERRSISWYRTEYPIARAQERIWKAGLPTMLAHRLAMGS